MILARTFATLLLIHIAAGDDFCSKDARKVSCVPCVSICENNAENCSEDVYRCPRQCGNTVETKRCKHVCGRHCLEGKCEYINREAAVQCMGCQPEFTGKQCDTFCSTDCYKCDQFNSSCIVYKPSTTEAKAPSMKGHPTEAASSIREASTSEAKSMTTTLVSDVDIPVDFPCTTDDHKCRGNRDDETQHTTTPKEMISGSPIIPVVACSAAAVVILIIIIGLLLKRIFSFRKRGNLINVRQEVQPEMDESLRSIENTNASRVRGVDKTFQKDDGYHVIADVDLESNKDDIARSQMLTTDVNNVTRRKDGKGIKRTGFTALACVKIKRASTVSVKQRDTYLATEQF